MGDSVARLLELCPHGLLICGRHAGPFVPCSLGITHQAGDALLNAFGHRLEYCLRPEDILGRLGGDEFAIVLPGIPVDDAKHIAARLVQTAAEAYIIQGQEITCAASVGIALMPKHGDELWHLISVADQAMYDAKAISRDDDAANDRAAYVDAATAL